MEDKWSKEYEPNDDELDEIEELLQKMEEEDEENIPSPSTRRIYYHYEGFEEFKGWLKKNGIKW